MIYSQDSTGKVLALLDWELSTLGYPLADLAYSAMCYHFPLSDKTGVRGLPRPLPEGRLYITSTLLVNDMSSEVYPPLGGGGGGENSGETVYNVMMSFCCFAIICC